MIKILITAPLCAALTFCQTLQSVQSNPGVQAAETVGIGIGLEVATGSPAFGFVAPIAVSGLTALANGSNPTAVTGIVSKDAPLITSTVIAAIPNSTGKTAAAQIAQAYTTAMQGLPATPAAGNAVIASIASGLTKGASAASAPGPRGLKGKLALYRAQLKTGQIDSDDYRANILDARAVEEMREIGARR